MGPCISKFGGASLVDGDAVRRVGALVRLQAGRQVLVVSALLGVTQALNAACDSAQEGVLSWDALRVRHRTILRQLDLPGDLLDRHLHSLRALLAYMADRAKLEARQRDHVLSFGERMSARLVAAHLRQSGQPAVAVDAFDLGLIHRPELAAPAAVSRLEREQLRSRLLGVEGIAVVTGFVAVDTLGDLTTLGPNGSDLTATWLAEALGAREVHLWKAVGGVFTADPKLVPQAQPLAQLGWDDAAALACQGASVLHPAAGEPARRADIPVRVRSVFEPHSSGTLVAGDGMDTDTAVAMASRKRVALLWRPSGSERHLSAVRDEMEALGLRLEARGIQPFSMHFDSNRVSLLLPDTPQLEQVLAETQTEPATFCGGLSMLAPVGRNLEKSAELEHLLLEVGSQDAVLLPSRPGSRTRSLLIPQARLGSVASHLHDRLFGHRVLSPDGCEIEPGAVCP